MDSAAAALGVETGALAKAAALRGIGSVAADVVAGRVRLRARSRPSSGVAKPEPAVPVEGGVVVPPADVGELAAIVAARRAAGL